MRYSLKHHIKIMLVVSAILLTQFLLTSAAHAQDGPIRVQEFVAYPDANPDRDYVISGEPITLRWNIVGGHQADKLALYVYPNNGYGGGYTVPIAPSGILTIDSNNSQSPFTSSYDFTLLMGKDGEDIFSGTSLQTRKLQVHCRYLWYMLPVYSTQFPPRDATLGRGGCPTRPLVSQASQQQFENGFMLWIKELDEIWVVTNGQLWKFKDTFEARTDSIIDHSLEVPNGRLQPRFGFGKVWRNNPNVRNTLGWATERPVDFETVGQKSAYFRATNEPLLWRLADGSLLTSDGSPEARNGQILTQHDGYANPYDGFRPELDDTPASSRTPNTRPQPPQPPQPPTGSDIPCPASGKWPPGCNPNLPPTTQHDGNLCPVSGKWPPGCTPRGTTPPPPGNSCVIPPSGKWPPCATAGDPPPSNIPGNCIIPPAGKWPPCARGG